MTNHSIIGEMEKKLTARQKAFCKEYLIDLNATQAAIRAGYNEKNANKVSARMLTNVDIQVEISKALEAREKRTEITSDKVLTELSLLGFSDLAHYLDVNTAGLVKVKSLNDLPPGISKAIKKIKQKTSIRYGADGATIQDAWLEVELYDKPRALELIGNHLGMFAKKGSENEQVDLAFIADLLEANDVPPA